MSVDIHKWETARYDVIKTVDCKFLTVLVAFVVMVGVEQIKAIQAAVSTDQYRYQTHECLWYAGGKGVKTKVNIICLFSVVIIIMFFYNEGDNSKEK